LINKFILMNILYDYQIFGLQRYGGISRYFYEIAKEIDQKYYLDNKVNIISPFFINEYINSLKRNSLVKGIKIKGDRKIGKILNYINKCISPILISQFKADILHSTYYFDQSRFANFKGKRIITIHDMIHELFPENFRNSKKVIRAKREAIELADHIICISENTRNDLIKIMNIKYEKTSVIHHGFLSFKKITLKKNNNLQKPYILFVGNRDTYKNFKNLLLAYSSNNNLNRDFDLIAFGGGAFRNYELEFFKELKLKKSKIKYIEGNDNYLRDIYSEASVFVYPSLYEGFGLPPLEAMSCGCPVACSNNSSIPEVVGNAASFFDPSSISSISNSLESLLYDEEDQKKLVFAGYERIKDFGWDKCAKETFETYKKVIQ